MERKNKSESPALPRLLPPLEFPSPFSSNSLLSDASVFLPIHYEKSYSYPLVVWLSGGNAADRQLRRVMPKISLRNYIGISPQLDLESGSDDVGEEIFKSMDQIGLRYTINHQRVFVAGCGVGGTEALKLALTHPNSFAGAISLCGKLPETSGVLGHLRLLRKTQFFVTQCRQDNLFSESRFCENLKTLHVAGFSVTARQYPGSESINDQMLNDLDHWMMELINGYDMSKSDRTTKKFS